MERSDHENAKLCEGCTMCCEYFQVPIAKPKTKKKFDELIWVLHHGTKINIYDDDEWYLEVPAKCTKLDAQGRCIEYSTRPELCKEHIQEECEKAKPDDDEIKKTIRNKQELIEYAKKDPALKELIK